MIDPREILERLERQRFQYVEFTLSVLQIFVLQGELALSLSHPANNGPSRKVALVLLELLEDALVDGGVFTRDELADIHTRYGVEV